MTERLYVFCYDIGSNRVRRRVFGRLRERCLRVQRSVFEARLKRRDAERLARRCAEELEPGDSLMVYVVGADGLGQCRAYGAALRPEAGDFLLA